MRERTFTLTITCENAAFEDGPTPRDWDMGTQAEITRILENLVAEFKYDPLLIRERKVGLLDRYGNSCGSWVFDEGGP